jgi:hypothetical protein
LPITTPSFQERQYLNFCFIVSIAKGRILWNQIEVSIFVHPYLEELNKIKFPLSLGHKNSNHKNNYTYHKSPNANNTNNNNTIIKTNGFDAESENSEGNESFPSPTPSLDGLGPTTHSPYAAAMAAALNCRYLKTVASS